MPILRLALCCGRWNCSARGPPSSSSAAWRKWLRGLVFVATVLPNLALAIGAAGGFACGAWAINELAGPSVTWPGLALGAVSCGVMGAWGVLLIASFWAIARQALRNASRDE